MRVQSLLTAAALLPLAACFEPTIPFDPPAAELQEGEWVFEFGEARASGDCYGMDARDVEGAIAWAWIERHGDSGVSIDLEGLVLEGDIAGESLQASGSMDLYTDYGEEPYPDEPGWDDGDDAGYGGEEDPDAPVASEGGAPRPACEPYPEEENRVDVFMDADILAPDLMRGDLVIDTVSWGAACTIEVEFVAEAQDDDPCDCDCDCGCDDGDPEPMPGTSGGGSSSGSAGEEIVVQEG